MTLDAQMQLQVQGLLQLPELAKADAVIGIGSYFSGDSTTYSDVDLIVIRPVHDVVKKAVEYSPWSLDITICSLPYFMFTFSQSEGAAHWRETLRDAVILKDNAGKLAQCLDWINTTLEVQQFKSTDTYICSVKTQLANFSRKIANTQENEQWQMLHYLNEWVQCAYQLLCLQQKTFPAYRPTLKMQHLISEFPDLHRLLNEVFVAAHSHKQVAIEQATKRLLSECFPRIATTGVVFRKPISNTRLKGLIPRELAELI